MVTSFGKNLVFLVSAPRSGSTLLGAMLGSLPGVTCPPETWVQLLLSLFESNGGLADVPFDHRLAVTAFSELADLDLRREASRVFARKIYNRILRKTRATILIDKTPRYYHILPQLYSIWPEAQFVWIQRNPLDIIASCKDTWSISVAEQMGEVLTPHTYDSTASFDRLTSFFGNPSERKTVVRYEQLVGNPTTTLTWLSNRLGLTFTPDIVEYGKNGRLISNYKDSSFGDKKALNHSAPHQSSVGRWRDTMTQDELRIVLTTLGKRCFSSQGYWAEFEEACALSEIEGNMVSETGTWAENFQRAVTSNATHEPPVYFSAMRTIKNQATQLEHLHAEFDKANKQLLACFEESDKLRNERNLLAAQLADLRSNFEATEADRVARGRELTALYPKVEAYNNERNLLAAQIADLKKNFDAVESDRHARGELIEKQGRQISAYEAEIDLRLRELTALYSKLETCKNERNLLAAQIADLKKNFDAVESDRHARGELIEKQGRQISAYEAEIDLRLRELTALYPELDAIRNERNLLAAKLEDLQANFKQVEADRVARDAVIATQGARTSELEKFISLLEQDRDRWRMAAESGSSEGAEKHT